MIEYESSKQTVDGNKLQDNNANVELLPTTRRDFLTLTAGAMGTVGVGCCVFNLIRSMNPSADVLAQSSVEIDTASIQTGMTKVFMWRGKPVFIRKRTPQEIQEMQKISLKNLIDPQTDQERFSKNPEWLVVVGVCTHLGCVPNERRELSNAVSEQGWTCACHGSLYDNSGRVVRGPAPKNLEVPPYEFLKNGQIIKIG